MKQAELQGRIYYDADWNGHGEHYVFESKRSDENEWGTEVAFKLIDDRLSYQALTQVREWMRLGVDFRFVPKPFDIDDE